MEGFEYPHHTPEVRVAIDGKEIGLTYENTSIYLYSEPYDIMNHVYIRAGEDDGRYIFNNEDVIDTLASADFPVLGFAYPAPEDIEAYFTYQKQKLEQELEEMSDGD